MLSWVVMPWPQPGEEHHLLCNRGFYQKAWALWFHFGGSDIQRRFLAPSLGELACALELTLGQRAWPDRGCSRLLNLPQLWPVGLKGDIWPKHGKKLMESFDPPALNFGCPSATVYVGLSGQCMWA